MKSFILLILHFTLVMPALLAQTPDATVEKKELSLQELSLQERFMVMKTKSQTFNDYKVIKEYVLDGVWKIVQDSIAGKRTKLHDAELNISRLTKELDVVKNQVKQKEASVSGMVYNTTHINVLGLEVNKIGFITFVIITIIALLILLGIALARLKFISLSVAENAESLTSLSKEYNEFKHKALDKQTKLSRELQNERNKLQELRPH